MGGNQIYSPVWGTCPPCITLDTHQSPSTPWSARETHASRASMKKGLRGAMVGLQPRALASWARSSWSLTVLPGKRIRLKKSSYFPGFLPLFAHPLAPPHSPPPNTAAAKGHIPRTLAPGELGNRTLAKTRVSRVMGRRDNTLSWEGGKKACVVTL